jgi:hypothetical protein
LGHQICVLQRSVKRPKRTPADRLLWAWLYTVWQDWKSGVFIMNASTVVGRHRKGLASQKDSPEPRPVQHPDSGRIIVIPEVGGLHHRYERYAA